MQFSASNNESYDFGVFQDILFCSAQKIQKCWILGWADLINSCREMHALFKNMNERKLHGQSGFYLSLRYSSYSPPRGLS